MEVQLPALLGNYDRQTNQPANQWTGMSGHREITLSLKMFVVRRGTDGEPEVQLCGHQLQLNTSQSR